MSVGRDGGPLLSLKKQIKRAVGDTKQIMVLISQAEQQISDQRILCEVCALAMRACGPEPLLVAADEYGELCLKRLQALCQVDENEARQFFRFLKHQGIRQRDARTFLLRAEMEIHRGQVAKARTVLEGGLASGAQPSEAITRLLQWCCLHLQGRGPAVPPEVSADLRDTDPASIRPRTLRYSGASDGMRAGEAEPPGTSCAAAPKTGGNPASSANAGGGGSPVGSSSEWTRTSALDNLSPILEADSAEISRDQLSRSMDVDSFAPAALQPPVRAMQELRSCSRLRPTSVEVDAPRRGGGAGTAPTGTSGCLTLPSPGPEVELSDMSLLLSDAHEIGTSVPSKPPKPIIVRGVTYMRLQLIGRGGSSKVYLVQGPSGEMLALKRVVTTCSSHFEALKNEVTLLRQLQDCSAVIRVFHAEVLPERGEILIVMERGEMDLGRFLHSELDLSLGDIQALWRQMLEAVQVIHDKRIVHSDLKPGNFLLVNGRLKLIDFGIAKRIASETTHISRDASVGTISYMAPEALRQGELKLGRPSDIWSLGIILYQMVYRRSPFAHLEPMQRLFVLSDPNAEVSFPSDHRLQSHSEETKAQFLDVVERCLKRDPALRPAIPELLDHAFLRNGLSIDRSAFDRVMETLAAGFFGAAREVLRVGCDGEVEGEEDQEEEAPHTGRWEGLADEMWDMMSRSQSGKIVKRKAMQLGSTDTPRCGTPVSANGESSFDPFRDCLQRWLTRGSKRQRLAAPTLASERGSGTSLCPAVPQTPKRPPVAPDDGRAADRAACAASGLSREQSAISPLLLQSQLGHLRKVSHREFDVPRSRQEAPPEESSNVALRRLKERRTAVDPEDLNQCTAWAVRGGA